MPSLSSLLQVAPEKLGVAVRDGIRTQLLDSVMLHHLEATALINWNSDVVWQARPVRTAPQAVGGVRLTRQQQEDWISVDHLAPQLEEGYHRVPNQTSFTSGFNTFQVDFEHKQLVNAHTGGMFELRRLGFAPLMPLKVCITSNSLIFNYSISFFLCL